MTEQILTEYLVNSIWQVPLLAAGAWIILRVVQPGPIVQHRVWAGALPLMLAMPLLTLRATTAAPIIPDATPSASELSAAIPANLPTNPNVSRIEVPPPPADPGLALQSAPLSLSTPRTLSSRLHAHDLKLAPSATHWLIGLYLAITAFLAIRLLSSWWLALRIVARATPAKLNGSASALLNECCERVGVERPNVLVSAKTSSPMLVGVFQPALLLPEAFAAQLDHPATPSRDVEAVWLHELVHLRRRDYLANFACRIAALPIAYHPATFAVQQRIRQTREMVCDAAAATEMESPVGYARCLVSLARNMHGTVAQIEGVGILDGGILEERIMQLINRKSTTTTRTQITRLVTGAAMTLTVLAASAMFHLTPTMAQTTTPTQPQAVIAPTVPIPAAAQSQPSAPPQTATPAAPADPAQPARPAIQSTEPKVAAQIDTSSPALRQQLAQARRQLDEATRAYENLLRQQYAIDGKGATADSGTANADLKRRLADAQSRLSENATLMAQQNGALMREQLRTAEVNREIAEATLNNPALKKQLEDATAKLNSPEFKEKMEKMQQLIQAQVNSPEFKTQMEKLHSPELKKQMADAQAKINAPEFRERMENLSKQLAEAQARLTPASPEMRMRNNALGGEFDKQMDEVRSLIDEALKEWDAAESAPTAPPQ